MNGQYTETKNFCKNSKHALSVRKICEICVFALSVRKKKSQVRVKYAKLAQNMYPAYTPPQHHPKSFALASRCSTSSGSSSGSCLGPPTPHFWFQYHKASQKIAAKPHKRPKMMRTGGYFLKTFWDPPWRVASHHSPSFFSKLSVSHTKNDWPIIKKKVITKGS